MPPRNLLSEAEADARAAGSWLPTRTPSTVVAGTGSILYLPLVLPVGVAVAGEFVFIQGIVTVRHPVTREKLCVRWLAGTALKREVEGWEVLHPTSHTQSGTGEATSLYFELEDGSLKANGPSFGVNEATGELCVSLTARADAPTSLRIAFRGHIANVGDDL